MSSFLKGVAGAEGSKNAQQRRGRALREPLTNLFDYDIVEPLTLREEEILEILADNGLSDKEIAEHFFIAPRTVWRHLSNIYGKLGVANRTEAVIWLWRKRTSAT